jgi:hypothetical protein
MKPALPTGLPWRRIKHFCHNSNRIKQGGSNMTGTDLCVNMYKSVPVIFEPPCICNFQEAKCIYHSNMWKSLLYTQVYLYHRTGIQHISEKTRKMFTIHLAKTGKQSQEMLRQKHTLLRRLCIRTTPCSNSEFHKLCDKSWMLSLPPSLTHTHIHSLPKQHQRYTAMNYKLISC